MNIAQWREHFHPGDVHPLFTDDLGERLQDITAFVTWLRARWDKYAGQPNSLDGDPGSNWVYWEVNRWVQDKEGILRYEAAVNSYERQPATRSSLFRGYNRNGEPDSTLRPENYGGPALSVVTRHMACELRLRLTLPDPKQRVFQGGIYVWGYYPLSPVVFAQRDSSINGGVSGKTAYNRLISQGFLTSDGEPIAMTW